MHRLSSAFILGYHGCRRSTATAVVGRKPFRPSENDYDWLGPGIYFWEANPRRGLEFVRETQRRRGGIQKGQDAPDVVGAAIDLGLCLDLTTSIGIEMVQVAYESLRKDFDDVGYDLPTNSKDPDMLMRPLDCAVVNRIHTLRKSDKLPPYQSVRGLFREGQPVFENSGFYAKTHVQIAVVDPSCIKGVFRVPKAHLASSD